MDEQITKEYFDQKLGTLPTKQEMNDAIEKAVAPLATKQDVRDAVEELARITRNGFEDLKERLDVKEDVANLQSDMQFVKQVLEIN